jgi:hypothetical protein
LKYSGNSFSRKFVPHGAAEHPLISGGPLRLLPDTRHHTLTEISDKNEIMLPYVDFPVPKSVNSLCW